MKSHIKKLLRESIDNFGYRAGDLNVKAEPKSNMSHSNRHTGHFGTGFYFFGDRDTAKEYAKITGDRGISVIDLSGYNLVKGTKELHDMLKGVNDSYFSNDFKDLSYYISRVLNKYGKLTPHKVEFAHVRNSSDYNKLSDDEINKYNDEMDYNLRIDSDNEQILDNIIDLMRKDENNSPSTVLMKHIGFDGVDSRFTELDNARYGSIIYDIKK